LFHIAFSFVELIFALLLLSADRRLSYIEQGLDIFTSRRFCGFMLGPGLPNPSSIVFQPAKAILSAEGVAPKA
jgi:hypothetical protein